MRAEQVQLGQASVDRGLVGVHGRHAPARRSKPATADEDARFLAVSMVKIAAACWSLKMTTIHLDSRIAHKRRRQNGKILLATTVGRGGGSVARTPSACRSMAPATFSLPEERGQVYTTKHRQSASRGRLVFCLEKNKHRLAFFATKKRTTQTT